VNATSSEPESQEQSIERQLRLCRRMAELAMQLAETAALQAQKQAGQEKKPKGPDPAVTFIRLCTTIRQSIALEAKLTAGPKTQASRPASPRPEPKPKLQPAPATCQEPPGTGLSFRQHTGQKTAGEPAQTEPAPDELVLTPVFDGKAYIPTYVPRAAAASAGSPSPAPSPPEPAWTPPPPHRRATDPPRPTGPNWARRFQR